MDHVIEEIPYKGYTIKVYQDLDPMNPRTDWDNFGTMTCFHRDYQLGDKHDYKDAHAWLIDILSEFLTVDEQEVMDEEQYDMQYGEFISKYVDILRGYAFDVLPLYLYDHSGITMNTTGFQCPWDTSKVGFIYAFKLDVEKEFIKTEENLKDRVRRILLAEVEVYDNYLTGNVYGYHVEDKDGEHIGSCYGYFGTDADLETGILVKDARDEADRDLAEIKRCDNMFAT